MIKITFFGFTCAVVFLSGAICAAEKFDPQKMSVSDSGVRLIGRFEGFREKTYVCPGGKPTIGFGHVVKPLEAEKYSGVLTEAEGYNLLKADIVAVYEPDIKRLVKVPLTQGQFDALTSFDYNLGAKNLGESTLLKHLNGGAYHEASLQFPLWRNAGGKPLQGLVKRRVAEMFIFRDDDKIPEDLATIPTKNKGETLLTVYQDLPQGLKDEARSIFVAYKANWR
jgi:lysozyme